MAMYSQMGQRSLQFVIRDEKKLITKKMAKYSPLNWAFNSLFWSRGISSNFPWRLLFTRFHHVSAHDLTLTEISKWEPNTKILLRWVAPCDISCTFNSSIHHRTQVTFDIQSHTGMKATNHTRGSEWLAYCRVGQWVSLARILEINKSCVKGTPILATDTP